MHALRSRWIGLIVLVVLLAAACGPAARPDDAEPGDEGPATTEATEVREVAIGQSGRGTPFAPVYLAQAKGFFEEEGLTVGEIASLGGGVGAALLAGDIDFAMGGINGVVAQHAEGITGNVAVEQFTNPTARQLIVADGLIEEAGIDPGDPLGERLEALEGATVGVLVGTGIESILLMLVRRHGNLEEGDLDVIEFPSGPGAMLGALGRRIDAFMWNPPFGPLTERQGTGRPIASVTELPEYRFPELILTTRRDLVEEDPELVERVVRAIYRGKRLMADDPEEAARLLVPVFEGSDEELMSATLDLLNPVVPVGEGFTEDDWEAFLDLWAETGELTAELDPSEGSIWTNQFIDAVSN